MDSKTPLPKEPRAMKTLYKQIMEHPDYKTKLSDDVRSTFHSYCIEGFGFRVKEYKAWARTIWKYLYIGTPMKTHPSLM